MTAHLMPILREGEAPAELAASQIQPPKCQSGRKMINHQGPKTQRKHQAVEIIYGFLTNEFFVLP
jgi:hypothetical protein